LLAVTVLAADKFHLELLANSHYNYIWAGSFQKELIYRHQYEAMKKVNIELLTLKMMI